MQKGVPAAQQHDVAVELDSLLAEVEPAAVELPSHFPA